MIFLCVIKSIFIYLTNLSLDLIAIYKGTGENNSISEKEISTRFVSSK